MRNLFQAALVGLCCATQAPCVAADLKEEQRAPEARVVKTTVVRAVDPSRLAARLTGRVQHMGAEYASSLAPLTLEFIDL